MLHVAVVYTARVKLFLRIAFVQLFYKAAKLGYKRPVQPHCFNIVPFAPEFALRLYGFLQLCARSIRRHAEGAAKPVPIYAPFAERERFKRGGKLSCV